MILMLNEPINQSRKLLMTYAPVEDGVIKRPAETAQHAVIAVANGKVIKVHLVLCRHFDHQSSGVVVLDDSHDVNGRLKQAVQRLELVRVEQPVVDRAEYQHRNEYCL